MTSTATASYHNRCPVPRAWARVENADLSPRRPDWAFVDALRTRCQQRRNLRSQALYAALLADA